MIPTILANKPIIPKMNPISVHSGRVFFSVCQQAFTHTIANTSS